MNTTLALVGGAHIHTPGFINKLTARPKFRVKSVWDHDADRARRRAEALGAAAVAEAVQAIWKDPDIGAVVICSETDRHAELVRAAARARKHLFVEKPLGMAGADAAQMARAIRKAGVIFQTGYFMRGNPIHRFLHEHVRKGTFGTVTRVRGSNCHGGAIKGWFDTEWRWMADPAQAGCGAYGDLGTHALDLLMWICGDVKSVAAFTAGGTRRYGKCDEFGEGLLQFKSGAIGTLAASWDDTANPVSLEIAGTQGHAVVMNGQLYLQSEHLPGADGKAPWTALPEALPHAFDLFLDALEGKQDLPLVTPEEAAARSRVMGALYTAARTHAWVKLA